MATVIWSNQAFDISKAQILEDIRRAEAEGNHNKAQILRHAWLPILAEHDRQVEREAQRHNAGLVRLIDHLPK